MQQNTAIDTVQPESTGTKASRQTARHNRLPIARQPRTGAVLFVIALGSFLATFNETMLNIALVPLMQDFSIAYGQVQWVVTLNMLVIAVMIPIAGFLMRRIQTSALVVASLVITLAGSLLGIVASSFPLLLAARVVQAIGMGITMPVTMALTVYIAPEGKLGTYMGIVSVLTTLGPSAGPIVSGLILGVTGNWHAIFICFAALMFICLAAAIVVIPNAFVPDNPHLDIPSVLFVSLALVGVMYGITAAFGSSVAIGLVCLAIGIIALTLFVRRQKRIANPLVNLEPFSSRSFCLGAAMMSLAFITTFSMNIVLPIFLEGAMNQTATQAALILLPATLCSAIFSPLGGRIFDKHGIIPLVPLAFTFIMLGTFTIAHFSAQVPFWLITLVFVPVVVGTALGTSPSQSFALSSLSEEMRNSGVTVVAVALQIAGCIGSSMFVGIMGAVEASALANGASTLAAQTTGFHAAVYCVCAVALLGFCLSLVTRALRRR